MEAKFDSETRREIPIIGIGRSGGAFLASNDHEQVADDAILTMFQLAESSIKLFIQDFGGVSLPGIEAWIEPIALVLADRIQNGVQVDAILSGIGASPGDGNSKNVTSSIGTEYTTVMSNIHTGGKLGIIRNMSQKVY